MTIINEKELVIFAIIIILNIKVMVIKINLSLDEYLNKIKPYLKNIITDPQNSNTQKIQLTVAIYFISSKVAK